ncbi:MAG: hypothetical protein V1860_03965 [bacterium]
MKNNINSRASRHPLGYPNAGSIFKNVKCESLGECKKIIKCVQISRLSEKLIKDKRDDEVLARFKKMGNIPAGYFLEECCLKGIKMGGAMISAKHANIIVNFNKATAKDVIALMKLAKNKVKENFGISLENEIEVVESS